MFFQVEAFDEDLNNEIVYSLSSSDILEIHPKFGRISLSHPEVMSEESYEVLAFAQDQTGQTGTPATVHISVDHSPMVIYEELDMFSIHRIQKRELQREDRGYVVRENIYGDLFSVAPVPPVDGERYYFVEPAPENLTLDSITGMVSRENYHVWNGSMETFMVNITFEEG